jgi:prolyl oligopeptidase
MTLRKFAFAAAAALIGTAALAQATDPYLWLENITGAKALQQVKAWNAETEAALTKTPGYEEHRKRALAILNDPRQIAMPDAVMGELVANHWIDAEHKRGLWRVSPLSAYLAGKPEWRTLIDVDALGAKEGKSWVWHGANCLAPEYRRCLVSLSPGGGDADVIREFDIPTGQFVADGFTIPLGKNDATWIDRDHLLVARVEGEGAATRSGYPRIVREWTRGTPWSAAKIVAQGTEQDIAVRPFAVMDGDTRYVGVDRGIGFYADKRSILRPDGQLIELPIPETAEFKTIDDGQVMVSLVDPLGQFQPGSVVAFDLAAILEGEKPAPTLVMAPTAKQAFEQVGSTDNVLWIKALEDVSGKLFALRRQADGSWTRSAVSLPANSTIQIVGGADKQDIAFATVEGMLDPTSLVAVTPAGVRAVQALPAEFDASGYSVEQRFATSKDGTQIPYFLVRNKSVTAPTGVLIHAYGGFRLAQTPTYLTEQPYRSGPLALFELEDGNAFVLANLRGGGEYGPAWHKATMREKHQNAFDDLEAVARDLIATGVARKDGVAISGRSNGGLLVGAAMTQHPELYSAVIAGSPLEDMKRYSHLLAGASWIDEYGDPDKPADWAFIKKYSPYQNVRRGVKYPPVFFYLSTKDDRVHPGHARKMAAKLKAFGNPVFYHEYTEGGHSGGAGRSEHAGRGGLGWGVR